MKGNLALDTIVGWIILLVAAGVVIGLIFHYSGILPPIINPTENPETEYVEAKSFSESQIDTYARLCWDKTGETFNKDFICYVLKGNIAYINPKDVEGDFGDYVIVANFNNTKAILTIRFEDIGNKIIIEN
jgi:hypothetical protein